MMASGVLRIVLGAAVITAVAAATRTPYDPYRTNSATLRLSWRARGEKVRHCRTLSAAEQANIPAHMRRTEECTERGRPYHVQLVLDDSVVLSHVVHAAGARQDRPVYVWYEDEIEPGEHHVRVAFTPVRLPGDTAIERGVEIEEDIDAEAGDVVLVTYDDGRHALQLRAREHSHEMIDHHHAEQRGQVRERESK